MFVRSRARSAGRFARLIAILHAWAESGWAGPAVGSWAFLQSSVVPGPADALLAPLGLADPQRVWRLAAWAIAGATLGGAAAYLIGIHGFDNVGAPILALIGVGAGDLESTRALFAARGWLLVLASSLTPVSSKLVCIAAGAFGVPAEEFLGALALGRLLRYLLVAALLRFAGERVVAHAERLLGRPIDLAGRRTT